MTYPAQPGVIDRRVVGFTYGATSGTPSTADIINEKLSRITSMTTTPGVVIAGTNIADFDWSGTGRRAKQSMGAGRIVRDTRAISTDVGFTNLDHFGRMKDFAFRGGAEGSAGFSNILYRAQYGYDSVGNRTSSKISEWAEVNGAVAFADNLDSVESLYDALNRLTGTKSGVMASGQVGSPTRTDTWKLDLLGNWVGEGTYPGRKSERTLLPSSTVETRSSTHTINERNELTFVDFAAENATNPPPPVDTTTIYDPSGNLVYDGIYFYQYDAWGRLIQINQTTPSETQIAPASPTPCPLYNFTIGAMIKHFTYDGLGRLVRVQSPWPDPATANGGVRSERFYYDGARRIQEMVTDPFATIELLETPEGGVNNPELGELLNQTMPGGTGGLDGSANPLNFESGQLENPNTVIGFNGEPLPISLSGMEREYIWGPGDNGLDEILVQYDIERKPFWMIQDGGGDVVAMCDLQGSGGTARVVKSWQYDAYGQCLRATDVASGTSTYSIPMNRIGHKGLFMDRLDVSIADPGTYADNPRLAPFSTVLCQNRNRTYSPQLGRFIQRDPNETGQLLAAMRGGGGKIPSGAGSGISLQHLYGDGGSTFAYLRGSPQTRFDPMGLGTEMSLAGRLAVVGVSAVLASTVYVTHCYVKQTPVTARGLAISAGAGAILGPVGIAFPTAGAIMGIGGALYGLYEYHDVYSDPNVPLPRKLGAVGIMVTSLLGGVGNSAVSGRYRTPTTPLVSPNEMPLTTGNGLKTSVSRGREPATIAEQWAVSEAWKDGGVRCMDVRLTDPAFENGLFFKYQVVVRDSNDVAVCTVHYSKNECDGFITDVKIVFPD